MLGLLRRGRQRWVCRFSEGKDKNYKSTGQYLRMKKVQQRQDEQKEMDSNKEDMDNAHKILYSQYVPMPLFAIPMFYFMQDPTNILFLQCCNAVQYYSSGLLCFNAFFKQNNPRKYYTFMIAVGFVNCLTGVYSLVAPVALGLLNLLVPFTNQELHKFQTVQQQEKITSYMRIQGLFYFVISVLMTLKSYYFVSLWEMQKKLEKYQQQNSQHFQSANI